MADVLLPIFLPFEYLTHNNPPLLVCVFRLGFHADSVDCIFIPTWWCEGRGFDPQWRQAFLCLCGFIWVLHAEDVTHWSCTNPPSGLHIWYNPCTIIHVVILVRGLKVHIYWTQVVSTSSVCQSVSVLRGLFANFRRPFRVVGRGFCLDTTSWNPECCSGFWPSGTFYIHARSSGAEQEWHLSSWSCLLPRTFFSSYSWVRADGQLRDPAFPRSPSWCNPASDLGGFYSDVHGELWLLISMRGLFQINQISFRRTQIKVQKHLRDDEEQHKALSAKVQGPYQSLLMSVEHFRCTCSEVSKTSCREILYFLTTAD